MRRDMAAAAALMVAGFLATGCRTRFFQTSINPFFEATEAPGDLAGRWIQEGKEGEGLDFLPGEKNEWQVGSFETKEGGEEEKISGGVVRFGRVGGTLYWDMTAAKSDATGGLAMEHLLELHSVARVRLDGDTMELSFLDPDWMAGALADGRVSLEHFHEGKGSDDTSIILTAPTRELEALLKDHDNDPEAFGDPELYHRVR
jgi:hypothetical protein